MGCPFIIKDHINYECVNGPEKKPKDNYLTVSRVKIIFTILDRYHKYIEYYNLIKLLKLFLFL